MKIAIITNKTYQNCETFIKAQIDQLPYEKVQYWGFESPFNITKNESLLKRTKNKFFKKKADNEFVFLNDLKVRKIEIVLAQYGIIGTKVLSACKVLQLPLVVHFHGHDAVRKSVIEKYGSLYKEMFDYEKSTIISVSTVMTKRLIELGCPEPKIRCNTYGPDSKFIELEPTFLKNQLISIGRFVEKKAPHLTLLAFSKVVEKYQNIQLVMAGDGVLLDSCKDIAKALRIENNVLFPGRISPDIFREYLKESLAYVQHSIEAQDGDMEGTPVSILEASGAGLPIVSTFHAGIPDVIQHESTGLLGDEFDIATMAKNMLWIIENKKEAIAMGKKGKHLISENFSMQKHINGLTTIINSSFDSSKLI